MVQKFSLRKSTLFTSTSSRKRWTQSR